jgi:hypothetical protein
MNCGENLSQSNYVSSMFAGQQTAFLYVKQQHVWLEQWCWSAHYLCHLLLQVVLASTSLLVSSRTAEKHWFERCCSAPSLLASNVRIQHRSVADQQLFLDQNQAKVTRPHRHSDSHAWLHAKAGMTGRCHN